MAKSKAAKRILVGHRIEEERLRLGLSRPELARRLGLDPSTVRYWAQRGTGPRDLQAVAEALGVTPAHLWRAA